MNTLCQKEVMDEGLLVTERGKFARICIEVDLRKVLKSKFCLRRKVYKVEYK